jgi:tetratricopeptide (TPR) repeat protein
MNQGRWKEAEELNVQAMQMRKRVLGDEHPDTLTSMANLASTYMNQGRWKEAEELNVQAMQMRRRVLGDEHPDTLLSMSNLAQALSGQGKYEEAETMNRQTLAIREVLGREHHDTLTSMSNPALVLSRQGKYEEAAKLNRRALEGQEKALGEWHPDTPTSVSDSAAVLQAQGKYKEAEELSREHYEALPVFVGQASARSGTYIGQNSIGLSQDETLIGQEEPTIMSKKQNVEVPDDSSTASHTTTRREKLGKAYIARFLAADVEMRVLCSSVLDRVGQEQFVDIGRQMLKSFHLGLLEYAKTELEKQGARLLKSRSGRRRICKDIADIIKSEKAQNEEEKARVAEQLRLTAKRLEMFTKDFPDICPDFNSNQPAEDEGELSNDYNDAIRLEKQDTDIGQKQDEGAFLDRGLESELESEDDDLPNLTRMKEFFRESEPFQVLLNDLRIQLLPHSLRDIVQTASHGSLSLSNQHNNSLSNRMKAFTEDFTMLEWNWWPLEPRMRNLNSNETRLFWHCVSRHPMKILKLMLCSLVVHGSGKKSPGTTPT